MKIRASEETVEIFIEADFETLPEVRMGPALTRKLGDRPVPLTAASATFAPDLRWGRL